MNTNYNMNSNENQVPANCPMCGRHCPIDNLSCGRGRNFLRSLQEGTLPEAESERRNTPDVQEGRHGHGAREDLENRHGHGGREDFEHHHGHGGREDFANRHEHGGREENEDRHGHEGHRGFGRPDGHGHPGMEAGAGPRFRAFAEDDDSLPALMHRTLHSFRPRRDAFSGQERVLRILAEEEETPQFVLLERMHIQPGSLSELIGKLEQKGLVEKIRDTEDKRRITLRLTPQGKETVNAQPEQEDNPFAVLSEEEQEQLKTLLKKVLDSRS
ncbi:MAG: winged helix-turn-helix transcriptional regulator [Clostridia bacterium]|nr:winged helix-turn-helix transcriptional regulator [Clostridia bacterium]